MKKVLILISDVMVWNETPKKVKEKVAPPPKEGEEGEGANPDAEKPAEVEGGEDGAEKQEDNQGEQD